MLKTNTISTYTSKVIKASALLADTKTLLAHWDTSEDALVNLQRMRESNIFGKASRGRVEDILAIFRQRYLSEPDVVNGLVYLVRGRLAASVLDKILFFHTVQNDLLLYDFVVEVLAPYRHKGKLEITTEDVRIIIAKWVDEGRTTSEWSEYTQHRVAQGILATLRDFGILEGAANKRLAPTYLPLACFVYVAFYLRKFQPSGDRLAKHPAWQLFFLSPNVVERFFVEAQQHHLLDYHAAGSIIRIDFPADTLSEYADVILKRLP